MKHRNNLHCLLTIFGSKERTESTDAHIRYSKKKQKYVLVKQVQGNQIDENRLISYVDEVLDENLKTRVTKFRKND